MASNFGTYKFGFNTGSVSGIANREDLLGMIVNIDPYETPFMTQCPKSKANHVVHEWLEDTLAATSTAGAIEGDAYSYVTSTTPTRVLNLTQIFRKDIGVSRTQRKVNPAGFSDAYAYEIEKATKEIARNIETTVFSAASSATGASATARVMKTFQTFISTNTARPASLGAAATAGQLVANDFNGMLETIYTAGGNPEQAYASPRVKRIISAFTLTQQNRNIAAVEKKLVVAVDVFDSDFGLIQIVPDRFVPQATNTTTAASAASDVTGNLFFIERAKARFAWLDTVHHEYVGKLGDSVSGIVVGEGTLEVLNQKAHGRISAINNKSSTLGDA